MLGKSFTDFYRNLLFFLVMLVAFVLLTMPTRTVQAAGVVGNGTAASCTEAALDTALSGGGSISFNCGAVPVTITVTQQKVIAVNTNIDGGAANLITLSGGGSTRVFFVNQDIGFSISNITIANGRPSTNSNDVGSGGGIFSSGFLTVTNSVFINNNATGGTDSSGGAIRIATFTRLTVSNSTFTNNSSNSCGGALQLGIASNNEITSSSFTSNSSLNNCGGAIVALGSAKVNIKNSTFTTNLASSSGGAISYEGGGPLDIINSTFNGNVANTNGGAIAAGGASNNITNSTFTGNTAKLGGAVSGGSSLYNVTIAGNSSGVDYTKFFVSTTARNTIIANNKDYNCNDTLSETGAVGSNLEGPSSNSCGFSRPSADPKLAPLADNGGPTKTMGLYLGSPAIDAGNTVLCAAPPVLNKDQRGINRPIGVACDIGAFEGDVGVGPVVPQINLLPSTVRVASTLSSGTNPLVATSDTPKIGDTSSVLISVAGTNGIPSDATGVVGILTNISCEAGGNLRLWSGNNIPNTVNLNVAGSSLSIPSATTALNLSTGFVAPLDSSGKLYLGWGSAVGKKCGYALDITGYLTASSPISLLPSAVRLAATFGNNAVSQLTATGDTPKASDKSSIQLTAGGTNGIPANATGIVGILTNVQCNSGGNLRFWTGNSVPTSVNLNVPGSSLAIPNTTAALNLSTNFIAPLDSNGKVYLGWASTVGKSCGFAVDVIGYLSSTANFTVLPSSARVASTVTTGTKPLTASGTTPNVGDNSSTLISVAGTNGIPASAKGVIGIVTNVSCEAGGNLRFWSGNSVPTSVNLNVPGSSLAIPGATTALNLSTGFVASLDSSGKFYLGWASTAGKNCGFAVDIVGYFN